MSSLNRQFGVVTTIVLAATWIGHTQDKKDDSPAALVLERGETIDFTTARKTCGLPTPTARIRDR